MSEKIIIYGLGPFAKLMHYYFTVDSGYDVAGFCVDREFMNREQFCGLPVFPLEVATDKWKVESYRMFVAIGYRKMRNRALMYDKAKSMGYQLVNYISSHAVIHDNLVIGDNNVVMVKVNIEPWVRIGDNNIFWSDTLLGHNLKVGCHNYVSAKCLLAGDMVIKDLCFIGNGAVTINQIVIQDETQLLPGAVLTKSTKTGGKYGGNPARYVASHKEAGIIIKHG